jgi:imidazoleglycerol phosphate synthase glutamine amidotransferase subunit HisH
MIRYASGYINRPKRTRFYFVSGFMISKNHQQAAAVGNNIDTGFFATLYGMRTLGARLHPDVADTFGDGFFDNLFGNSGRGDDG